MSTSVVSVYLEEALVEWLRDRPMPLEEEPEQACGIGGGRGERRRPVAARGEAFQKAAEFRMAA